MGDIDEDKADPSSAAYERPTHVTGGMQATGPHPIATMTMTGPREGQSVEPAPSDEEEIAVRVAVSVQRALTGTPLISIDLQRVLTGTDTPWGAGPGARENFG